MEAAHARVHLVANAHALHVQENAIQTAHAAARTRERGCGGCKTMNNVNKCSPTGGCSK